MKAAYVAALHADAVAHQQLATRLQEEQVYDNEHDKDAAEQSRRYIQSQRKYQAQQLEEKRQTRDELTVYSKKVAIEAEERRQEERQQARERERTAAERLARLADEKKKEAAIELQLKEARHLEQAREMEITEESEINRKS